MKLGSKWIIELFELSGLSQADFCDKLKIDEKDFIALNSGDETTNTGAATLIKAVAVALFSKPSAVDQAANEKAVKIQNTLTEAHAIVVCVEESEHLEDYQQTSLSVAARLIEDARREI